jgi:predicted outer membrane protein
MAQRIPIAVYALASAAAIAGCDRGPSVDGSARKQPEEACATEPAAKLRAVFRYLHETNEAEIRAGNVTADRTTIPDVRQYATNMVAEHAVADQKLVDLARRERIGIETVPPADPIHAAALRYATVEEQGLQELAPSSLDVVYVASTAEQHGFALEVIEQGQRVATGDVKSLFDEAREMTSRHRDHALILMQDLHFVPRAIGGGPVHDFDSDEPTRPDRGIWPPVTAPPERTPDHP